MPGSRRSSILEQFVCEQHRLGERHAAGAHDPGDDVLMRALEYRVLRKRPLPELLEFGLAELPVMLGKLPVLLGDLLGRQVSAEGAVLVDPVFAAHQCIPMRPRLAWLVAMSRLSSAITSSAAFRPVASTATQACAPQKNAARMAPSWFSVAPPAARCTRSSRHCSSSRPDRLDRTGSSRRFIPRT